MRFQGHKEKVQATPACFEILWRLDSKLLYPPTHYPFFILHLLANFGNSRQTFFSSVLFCSFWYHFSFHRRFSSWQTQYFRMNKTKLEIGTLKMALFKRRCLDWNKTLKQHCTESAIVPKLWGTLVSVCTYRLILFGQESTMTLFFYPLIVPGKSELANGG